MKIPKLIGWLIEKSFYLAVWALLMAWKWTVIFGAAVIWALTSIE